MIRNQLTAAGGILLAEIEIASERNELPALFQLLNFGLWGTVCVQSIPQYCGVDRYIAELCYGGYCAHDLVAYIANFAGKIKKNYIKPA